MCLSSINSVVDVLAPLVLEPAGNREYLRVKGRKECMEQKRDKMVKENRRTAVREEGLKENIIEREEVEGKRSSTERKIVHP